MPDWFPGGRQAFLRDRVGFVAQAGMFSRWSLTLARERTLRSGETHSPPSSAQIIYTTGSHWADNHSISPGSQPPPALACRAHHPGEEVTGTCSHSRCLGLYHGLCHVSLPITGHPPAPRAAASGWGCVHGGLGDAGPSPGGRAADHGPHEAPHSHSHATTAHPHSHTLRAGARAGEPAVTQKHPGTRIPFFLTSGGPLGTFPPI